ncbi:putative defensin-like protein 179 [Vigna angularis]|uniref:putative defensin-like protein 179 n=1 Tax=Phaseolus angularis TaxID=3914 RepID=UPI00080A0826|nr:putative defensin-like protein 179 [Vigna angularis]
MRMVNHIFFHFLLFTIFVMVVTGQKEDSNGSSRDLSSNESEINGEFSLSWWKDDDPIRKCNGSQGLCNDNCDEGCCNSKCAAKYKDGVGTCKLYVEGFNFCICKYACHPN